MEKMHFFIHVAKCKRLDELHKLNVGWFEEPVHADDFRGGAQVAAALDMPVASGENEYTRWGFRDLIGAQAADIIQADPVICGGISEWMKIAARASAEHLTMAPHGGAHLGSTCVAAVHNGLITECGGRAQGRCATKRSEHNGRLPLNTPRPPRHSPSTITSS